jgi:DNA-binding NtrC family response regulator
MGLSVLDRSVEIEWSVPVLVLARHVCMESYLEAMQQGAVDYLQKPVLPDEMARVVRSHLQGKAAP